MTKDKMSAEFRTHLQSIAPIGGLVAGSSRSPQKKASSRANLWKALAARYPDNPRFQAPPSPEWLARRGKTR